MTSENTPTKLTPEQLDIHNETLALMRSMTTLIRGRYKVMIDRGSPFVTIPLPQPSGKCFLSVTTNAVSCRVNNEGQPNIPQEEVREITFSQLGDGEESLGQSLGGIFGPLDATSFELVSAISTELQADGSQ